MIRAARRWGRLARVRVRRWAPATIGVLASAVAVPAGVRLLGGSADTAYRSTANVVLYGSWILAFLLGSGGCGAQLRSGTALLWLQKPVSGARLYLDRVVPRLGATVFSILVLTGLGMGVAKLLGPAADPYAVRALGLTMALLATMLICMMYGFSGLGLPHEALFALGATVPLVFLSWRVVESPEIFGAALPLARAVALPLDAVGFIGGHLAGRPVDGVTRYLLEVVLYCVGWLALGTVGALWSTRSPLPRGSD